jgi:pentatricopeptide repeat protein
VSSVPTQSAEESAAAEFKRKIEVAARDANAPAAIEAFEQMKLLQLPIVPYLHRVVINVCANSTSAVDVERAAFKVFEDLRAHPDTASSKARADETVYSALIKICARSKDFPKCLALLEDMHEQKIEPRLRTYSSLLAAYADDGNLEKALWVHQQLHDHEIELTEAEFVALFRACVKAQDSEQFHLILEEYRETFLVPGPAMWDVLKEWFARYIWTVSILWYDNHCNLGGSTTPLAMQPVKTAVNGAASPRRSTPAVCRPRMETHCRPSNLARTKSRLYLRRYVHHCQLLVWH